MAGFTVLGIRAYENPGTDGRLYPLLSEEEGKVIAIAIEPADGMNRRPLQAASAVPGASRGRSPRT